MIDVAILNVTGYAGLDAALLLRRHPVFRLVAVSGRGEAGKRLSEVFPFWDGEDLRIEEGVPPVDLVICALPHAAAAGAIAPLYREGARVVDISADFRLHDADLYASWYGPHAAPDLLPEAVYGLPELHRAAIRAARLVANPGCYPTAALLALAPALEAALIEPSAVIDAKSGVSGGGRSLTLTNHFSEVNESVSAYGLAGHRHLPEIEQELAALAGQPVTTVFTPHLVPMTRGLLATCYARLRRPITAPEALALYRERYQGEPFVRVTEQPPATKWTTGTNQCLVHATVSRSGEYLVAVAAIDNLVKGAAGQAIQNANLLFDLPEAQGLDLPVLYP
ncbi:MAG TPA: N-acetyl-gamma-glutamyl-phosphate reductase [Chloroflexota bacterium]|nr:N-acetyl-gamma-glutamyl-phosphate reductase [Chloroflexota bacterium]